MMDVGYMLQKVLFYMQNPDMEVSMPRDVEQAMEIEKLRKAISDIGEAKRAIKSENQGIAMEVICLEAARQITIDRQRNGGQF